MKIKQKLVLLATILFVVLVISCNPKTSEPTSEIHIIPEPLDLKVTKGYFNFNEQTVVIVNSNTKEIEQVANYFIEQFNIASGSYAIRKGIYKISQKYFQLGNNKWDRVFWGGPGIEKQEIPASAYFHQKKILLLQ